MKRNCNCNNCVKRTQIEFDAIVAAYDDSQPPAPNKPIDILGNEVRNETYDQWVKRMGRGHC